VDAHLEVAGGRHPLAGDRVVIGRSPRSDIVLDADGQVSRTHAVLDRIAAAGSCATRARATAPA